MASILSHPAVPLGLSIALGSRVVSLRLLTAAIACSVLPDIDALGFWAVISYDHPLGHRGFTHSIFFAVLMGIVGSGAAQQLRTTAGVAFCIVFISTISHGVLDALTTGGLGVAFLSPFSNQRFFLPWQIIQVSPIGVSRFFSSWGLAVILSELKYVWLPFISLAALGKIVRILQAPEQ